MWMEHVVTIKVYSPSLGSFQIGLPSSFTLGLSIGMLLTLSLPPSCMTHDTLLWDPIITFAADTKVQAQHSDWTSDCMKYFVMGCRAPGDFWDTSWEAENFPSGLWECDPLLP